MTDNELNFLQANLSKCTNYLEFGSGNSTIFAVQSPHISKITVVESDFTFWKQLVNSNPIISDSIRQKRLNPLLINIGPTKQWGYPADNSHQYKWPTYASKAFRQKASYDLILVDARFRIACILQACLFATSKTRILVHDFFNRPYYFTVLPFLILEEKVDTMGLFRVKKNNDPRLIKEFISIYQYFPGY